MYNDWRKKSENCNNTMMKPKVEHEPSCSHRDWKSCRRPSS